MNIMRKNVFRSGLKVDFFFFFFGSKKKKKKEFVSFAFV